MGGGGGGWDGHMMDCQCYCRLLGSPCFITDTSSTRTHLLYTGNISDAHKMSHTSIADSTEK